jgi:hypothetical protein
VSAFVLSIEAPIPSNQTGPKWGIAAAIEHRGMGFNRRKMEDERRAFVAVVPCAAVRVTSFSNISLSGVREGAANFCRVIFTITRNPWLVLN